MVPESRFELPRRWSLGQTGGEEIIPGASAHILNDSLEVDPANLRFVFQGVSDDATRGKKYGEIPWQLGLLEPKE